MPSTTDRPWDEITGPKQETRNTFFEVLRETFGENAPGLRGLMIPGEDYHDLTQLFGMFDPENQPQIVAIEKDYEIGKKIDQDTPSNVTVFKGKTVRYFISHEEAHYEDGTETKFDFMWLDTTNIFTRNDLRMIHKLVDKFLKPKAILAVTFVAGGFARQKKYRTVIDYGRYYDSFEDQSSDSSDAEAFSDTIYAFVDCGEDMDDAEQYGVYSAEAQVFEIDDTEPRNPEMRAAKKRMRAQQKKREREPSNETMYAGCYAPLQPTLRQHRVLHTEKYRAKKGSMEMYFSVFLYDRTTNATRRDS